VNNQTNSSQNINKPQTPIDQEDEETEEKIANLQKNIVDLQNRLKAIQDENKTNEANFQKQSVQLQKDLTDFNNYKTNKIQAIYEDLFQNYTQLQQKSDQMQKDIQLFHIARGNEMILETQKIKNITDVLSKTEQQLAIIISLSHETVYAQQNHQVLTAVPPRRNFIKG